MSQSSWDVSNPLKTPPWPITLRLESIQCVAFRIALRSQFGSVISHIRYPNANTHYGVVAIRDQKSDWGNWVPQQNVNRSTSYTHTSQTLRLPSPVLLCTSSSSQAPLRRCKVLSDSARAFSGAPESTCSDGGAFRTL